jgi:hypothetical protein
MELGAEEPPPVAVDDDPFPAPPGAVVAVEGLRTG